MAGKVLTEEDFSKGGDPTKEDTSSQAIPADQKMDQDGKVIVEEPEKVETPAKVDEGGKEPLPKPSDEVPKYKHKTWEETEKARIELEKEYTKKSMRLSEVEKKLVQFEKPIEKPTPTIDDYITGIADEALKDIGALPTDSQTRDRDAAIIWAKAQRKISRMEIDETNKVKDAERNASSKLFELAKKEGFNMDDQDELEELGYQYNKQPSHLSAEEKISKTVESAKERLTRIRGSFVNKLEKDRERDKKEKDDLKVLGRGSSRKEGKEEKETKPTTMSQQLAELNEQRRIKKDDLRW